MVKKESQHTNESKALERAKKLALEKSYLELIIRMMNKISSATGLDNTIECMLSNIMDVIGGDNIILYYKIDTDFFYADVYGNKRKINELEDLQVKGVFESCKSTEIHHDFSDTKMTTPEFSKAKTWLFPLMIGKNIIGVIKMESLAIGMQEIGKQLPTFFNYAALVLNNEILGYTKLKKAHDKLELEVSIRKRIDKQLREAKNDLEIKVENRTIQLKEINEQLLIELLERKRIEKELRESEKKYIDLYDNAPDMYVSVDAKTALIKQCNQTLANNTGYSKNEIIGRPIFEMYHPDCMDEVESAFKQFVERGTIVDKELQLKRKDGSKIEVSLNVSAIRDSVRNIMHSRSTLRDISARKKAEEKLLGFSKILEESLDEIYFFDGESYKYIQVNKGALTNIGYSLEELKKLTPFDIKPEFNKQDFDKLIKPLKSGEVPKVIFETVHKRKDASLYPVEVHLQLFVLEHKQVFVAITLDITERKIAERNLKKLNRALKVINECNQLLVRTTDENKLLKEICQILVDHGGYKLAWVGFAERNKSKSIRPVMFAGHEEGYLKNLKTSWADNDFGQGPTAKAIRSKKYVIVQDVEANLNITPWGAKILKLGFKSFISYPLISGKKVIGNINIYSDEVDAFNKDEVDLLKELADDLAYGITSIRLKNEHEKAEAILRQNAFIDAALAETYKPLVAVSTTIEIIAKTILNQAVKLTGSVYGFVSSIDPETADNVGHTFTEMMKTGTCTILQKEGQRIAFKRISDGTYGKLWGYALNTGKAFYTNNPLKHRASEGVPEGHIALERFLSVPVFLEKKLVGQIALSNAVRDYTEIDLNAIIRLGEFYALALQRMRSEEALIEAKDKAEESDRLKSAFLANMSHEIRTPMNAIIGFSELLIDPELEEDKQAYYISIIQRKSDDLLNIINDILDISKIEAKQIELIETSGNLEQLFSEISEYFEARMLIEDKNIEFRLKHELLESQTNIICDFVRLKQIILNLLSNAIKFTSHGHIEFGCELKDSSTLLFYVKDTGIGISDNKKSIIFESFRQAEEKYTSRIFGGTGLGLSISLGLSKLMNGMIWVDSEEGFGSVFYLSIPYKVAHKVEPKLKPPKKGLSNLENNCILIVEDMDFNTEYLMEVLKPTKIKFLTAQNGISALKQFYSHNDIDLVLMDIRLPDINGFELTKKMKLIREDIIVIAQTAFAFEEDKQKCFESGCKAYLKKPIRKEELLEVISSYLHPE